MVDASHIGKTYPPMTYEIGKEKIREYAKAIGDMNPLYHDDETAAASEYGCIIAPPTFAVVYTSELAWQVLEDKSLKINLMMVVHGEMDFKFDKVVRSGDVITSTCEIKDIYEKKGNCFIVANIVCKNQSGEIVTRGKTTFVERGK